MHRITRLLTGATLAALLLGPIAITAAEDHDELNASTVSATAVAERSATLAGEVKNKVGTTSFRFEYGPTTSYGQSTPEGTLPPASNSRTVTAAVQGLTPGTLYHFRLRASDENETSTGADRTFTTTAGATPPVAGSEVPAPLSTAAPEPILGESVVVAPLKGTIKLKRPGSPDFVTLAAGDSVPVGSLIDTRRGTINLTSSLGTGKTQTGTFRGALFKVGQKRAGNGMTDLVLRGGDFSACRRTVSHASRATVRAGGRKSAKRRLWGNDKGGRFRTHGRASVATVRGTSWVTTDTCAGTRTTVKQGAVAVRDRRRAKTVLVRAGHSYLARHTR